MIRLEDNLYDSKDPAVDLAVIAEIRKWRAEAQQEYNKLVVDLERVEEKTRAYIMDTGVDHENVSDSGISEDNVCYWPEMLRHLKSSASTRANEAGIDLTAELGYKI